MRTCYIALIGFIATTLLSAPTVSACSLNPTAVISAPTAASSHIHGTAVGFNGSTSTANCGTIIGYLWKKGNTTLSTSPTFNYTVTLAPEQVDSVITVSLKVTSSTNARTHTVYRTITIKRDHQSQYFVKDHLGSPRVVVDGKGAVLSHTDYYPFGMIMPGRAGNISLSNDRVKFTGYLLEEEGDQDTYHAEARGYDPVIGRFTQVDPLSDHPDQVSLSPYNYSWNNPINLSDPTGKCPVCVFAGAAWLGAEIGLAAYDIYDVVTTLSDNNASATQKLASVVGASAGLLLPGGGYSGVDDAVKGGSKLINSGRLTSATLSYSNEVSDLVKMTTKLGDEASEIITLTKSGNFGDAGTVANSLIGELGDDAVSHVGRTGPFSGKVTGQKSADGSRGFRIDYDSNKGAHVNWWNGKQKGAIPFDGGLDHAKRIVDNVMGN
jgi:RHS repeat-associated protein